MNIRYNEAILDEPEEEVEEDIEVVDNICQHCAGTGLGRSEYDYCRSCHGSGINAKQQLDEDWSYLYD
jgi:DnaJ-class molecular chaperone